jgi:hypothetical protein
MTLARLMLANQCWRIAWALVPFMTAAFGRSAALRVAA